VLGYSAERAGMALMLGGFTLMLLMPLAALLGARMDRRYILGFGFAAMSFGLYHLTSIDLDIAFGQLEILRVIQLVGLPFIFVNITTLNYVGVPPEKHNQVSGLSNFSRNIGGAVGVSILNTFQFRQTQIQRANMSAHTNHANPFFEHQLAGITTSFTAMGFPSAQATQKALAQMSQTVDQQASVLSYVNAFWLMAVAVACLIPLVFLLKKPSKADEESTAHAH
jgi:MFS transporter, DHA2 family, multidrug resistance protein